MMIGNNIVNRMHPGQLLQTYLLASYCYYQMDESPMTDPAFDRLCVRLLAAYDGIDHQHKKFVNKEDLKAGSCFLPPSQFPLMVASSATSFLRAVQDGSYFDATEPHLMSTEVLGNAAVKSVARVVRRPPPPVVPKAAPRIARRPVVPVPTPTPEPVQSTIRRVRRSAI